MNRFLGAILTILICLEESTAQNTTPGNDVIARTVSGVASRPLSFSTTGRVRDLLVRAGDKVREGQLLARLHCEVREAIVAIAEAELTALQLENIVRAKGPDLLALTRAESSLEGNRRALESAREELLRYERLRSNGGMVSEHEVQGARRRLQDAETDLKMSETILAALQAPTDGDLVRLWRSREEVGKAQVRRARAELAECNLLASEGGQVIEIHRSRGDYVSPSDAAIVIAVPASTPDMERPVK